MASKTKAKGGRRQAAAKPKATKPAKAKQSPSQSAKRTNRKGSTASRGAAGGPAKPGTKTKQKSATKKRTTKPARKPRTLKPGDPPAGNEGVTTGKGTMTGGPMQVTHMTIGGVKLEMRELAVMLCQHKRGDANLPGALNQLLGEKTDREVRDLINDIWRGVVVDSHDEAMLYAGPVIQWAAKFGVQVSVSFDGTPSCNCRGRN